MILGLYSGRKIVIVRVIAVCSQYGKPESRAAYPLLPEGLTLQTKERRALPMYVTYADLIQLLIFIVALVGLIYEIFKDKRK